MADGEDGSAGGRPKSALMRRHEQLQRWKDSEFDKEAPVRNQRSAKVKFAEGCVFLAACASEDLDDIKSMLKKGANINYANIDGLTALHQAVIDEKIEMVEFLVEHGADIEAQDNEGWTALHAASSCGFEEIAGYLIENGANLIAVNNEGEIPLDLAEEEDMEEFLQDEMDKQGSDVDAARTEEEDKMLEDANQWLNSKIIKDRRHPKTGATSLHVASAKGYIKVMSILIQAGVDVNAKDNDGWTPLHAASHWGQKEACEVLAEAMCDMDMKNNLSQTAFDLADDEILKWLEELKKKQASMKKDEKPSAPRIDAKVPPPLKRRSSVTRISVPDRNMLLHQDMAKERRELEKKIHGTDKQQDKKTMESSSSSEEESESEEESSEEEEEPQKNSDKNQPASRTRPSEVNARLGRPAPIPQPASPSKKEMPSFSPKPLAQPAQPKQPAKQEAKQEEVPAWRSTGLRKTTSSSVVPEPKKPETTTDKLAKSASTPRIPTTKKEETKPVPPWENQRIMRTRDAPSTTPATTPAPRQAPAPAETKDSDSNRSIMTPAKEEESETQRKARAKRERSSRRSTQGVSAEDIESAVSTLKNTGKEETKPQDNRTADSNKPEPTRLRPRIAAATIENKEESTPSPRTRKTDDTPAVMTFTARPSRSTGGDSSSTTSATARLGRLGRDDKSATDEAKEKEKAREKEKEKEQDTSPKKNTTAISRRRPREKRRPTGEEDDDEEEEEEEEPPKSSDRYSRPSSTSSLGSKYGSDSSSVLDRSRPGSDRNSSTTSSRGSSGQPCQACKKLFEEKESLITKLQGQVKQKDQEIAELKAQTDRRSDSKSGDSDKRERRGLERRISELEEELKAMEQLKSDNQRLKDENGALVRVISKLSK